MASKITIKRSTTATPPAGLSFGEMAFVQGTGLTANQLYVGISGGSPVWVGAQIGTTGSWTDNAAKTSLATQYAIDQRISAQISGGSPITTVSDNTNATRYLVLSTSAAAGVTLFVDDTTGPLSYNPSTGALTIAGDLNVNGGDIITNQTTASLFSSTVTTLGIGLAATALNIGASNGDLTVKSSTLTVGSSGLTGSIFADDAKLILTTKNYSGAYTDASDTPVKIVLNPEISAGQVLIEGGDLRLGGRILGGSTSGCNIIFDGGNTLAWQTTLTVVEPTASNTLTLPNTTDTLVGKATTDIFTNKTYDTAGTGNVFRIAGVTLSAVTGTGSVVLATSPTLTTPNLGTPSTLVGTNITGTATGLTAGRVVTNANLTGAVISVGNATSLGNFTAAELAAALDQKTGSTKVVFDTSPTLVTPTIGVASATSINKVTITAPATGSTITVADGKTLTASNTLTFTGTDASSVAFGTGGTVVYNTSPALTTSLTTPSASFDLVNTTATTVNFAGAATTLNMGVLGGTATFAGALTVSGNLTVNGTTTTINSTTLTVDDKNIEMAAIGTPDDATANGGGIIIKGTTDKSILWDSTNSNLTSNQDWNLPTGKVFKINNASVLSSSALGSGITGSSLTQVGTITSGTWNASFAAGLIVNADINASAAIVDTKLATIATAGKVSNSATTATNANTASAIVARDASGNFTAGTITAALTGNASTATSATSATTATNATNIAVASETSDTTCFVTFVTDNTGNLPAKINSTLTYNAVSGELSATLIDGGSF